MSQIFLDRSKLSPAYVPDVLPHRDIQMKLLHLLFQDSLRHTNEAQPRATQLIGGVGTGKTCTMTRFGEEMKREADKKSINLTHIYVNSKLEGTKKILLYRNMLDKVSRDIATRSLSSEEMLHQMMRHLIDEDRFLLITVDEIEYFYKRSDEPIIYDLTRLNEIFPSEPTRVIGTVFISRDTSFHSHLDASELSSLGRSYIEFERYDSNQIRDILSLRTDEAFQRGAVDEEILGFISDFVSKEPLNGDIRIALDVLLYSGIYADAEGYKTIRPEHVRHVLRQTHPDITTEELFKVSENGRLVLLALIRALETSRTAYVSLRDIREFYNLVCEEQNSHPVSDIEEELQDLIDRGIVRMKSLTQFGIVGVTAKDLDRFLTGIRQRISNGVSG
jgi:orc1/cdc6 family replication initiation protein